MRPPQKMCKPARCATIGEIDFMEDTRLQGRTAPKGGGASLGTLPARSGRPGRSHEPEIVAEVRAWRVESGTGRTALQPAER